MSAAALNSQLFLEIPRREQIRTPRGFNSMDSRSERYRECAAECERMASGVSDPAIKALYLDLAKQWRAMAEQADMLDRERPTP
jgi:hypothetical protein